MEGCFLGLRNTRVFVGNVIGTNRHPLATASLTAGSLAARIAVSSRSMKISANMGQPPYWPDVYSAGGVWGLKLSLNLLGDFLEIIVLGCCRCTAPYTKHGSHGGKMRGSRSTLGILLVASITCESVQAAPRRPACIEIMASCEQAGFVRGDAKAGDGLFIDCVIPIVRGTPQRPRASKPLPQIDPKLVADCKIQNPNFGQRVARPPQPGEPAMQASPTSPPPEAIEPPAQSRPGTPPPQAPTAPGGI